MLPNRKNQTLVLFLTKRLGNFEELQKRFEIKCGLVADYPLDLAHNTSSGKGEANLKGNLRYVNEQIKATIRNFTRYTAHAFFLCYKKELQEEFDDVVKLNRKRGYTAMRDLLIEESITIEMNSRSIMSLDDVTQLHALGTMKKSDMAPLAFAQFGLSENLISLSDKPDMTAPEMLPEVAEPVVPRKRAKTAKDNL